MFGRKKKVEETETDYVHCFKCQQVIAQFPYFTIVLSSDTGLEPIQLTTHFFPPCYDPDYIKEKLPDYNNMAVGISYLADYLLEHPDAARKDMEIFNQNLN